MKSYALAPISSCKAAVVALSEIMPGQNSTWLLKDAQNDVVAYFSLVEIDAFTGLCTIQADISGRHYSEDAKVIVILRQLRAHLGGEIFDDNEQQVL